MTEAPPDITPPDITPPIVFVKAPESGAFRRRLVFEDARKPADDCEICLGYGTDFDARGNARPCPWCR